MHTQMGVVGILEIIPSADYENCFWLLFCVIRR